MLVHWCQSFPINYRDDAKRYQAYKLLCGIVTTVKLVSPFKALGFHKSGFAVLRKLKVKRGVILGLGTNDTITFSVLSIIIYGIFSGTIAEQL